MVKILRYLVERRKLLLLLVFGYAVAFHFVYSRYWNKTSPNAPNTILGGFSINSHVIKPVGIKGETQNDDNYYVDDGGSNGGIFQSLWNLQLPAFLSSSKNDESHVDIHLEDGVLGHTGEVLGGVDHNDGHAADHSRTNRTLIIAVGGGITSRGVGGVTETNIAETFQFYHTFIPTFCQTASPGYEYRFYLAFDHNDGVFANEKLATSFQKTFTTETTKLCLGPRNIRTSIHLVQCSHHGFPTWAQNDAMLEAYIDNVDYFYRINDDTRFTTSAWTEAFIKTLDNYDPPRVGVVGPNHSGGNTAIMTYDFMHRTHVDIFGFYYPRLFTDWWGDDWITMVYQPGRSTKLNDIRLDHTLGLGQRYHTHHEVGGKLAGQLEHDKPILNRYIAAVRLRNESGVLSKKADGRRVISMSLFGRDPRYTWGALRNAQLVPVHFPGWRLRVYVPSNTSSNSQLTVPPRIVNKLRLLGADVARVSAAKPNSLSPRDWRLLVADDRNVDFFLIRNADSRISDRDAAAVNDWIKKVEKASAAGRKGLFPLHCMRDHPSHANLAIVDGLWGGQPQLLSRILKTTLPSALLQTAAKANGAASVNGTATSKLIAQLLEPIVTAGGALCHDTVSPCDRWTTSGSAARKSQTKRPFPVARLSGNEHVGQKYDEHQELVNKNEPAIVDVNCNITSTTTTTATTTTAVPTTPTAVTKSALSSTAASPSSLATPTNATTPTTTKA